MKALLLVLFFVGPARADFSGSGDSQVTGQVGAGTFIPRARLEVRISTGDAYALKVSSQNGAPLLAVTAAGKVGIGTLSPVGDVDAPGSGDSGSVGLQLRVGNSSATTLSSQIVFLSSTGTMGHSIRTQAISTTSVTNAIDFFLWNSTGRPATLGNLEVLSLQAIPAASSGSVHILPVGQPSVELEVSNGVTLAGGTMEVLHSGPHLSRREAKSDISYLGEDRRRQAYEDVKALRHARFHYKTEPRGPLLRGLIYEDAPKSVQGLGEAVILDKRVLNLELALQEADGKIKELEALISALEKSKKVSGGHQ